MPTVLKSGSLNLLEPSGPVEACNGIALPLYTYMYFEYKSFPIGHIIIYLASELSGQSQSRNIEDKEGEKALMAEET